MKNFNTIFKNDICNSNGDIIVFTPYLSEEKIIVFISLGRAHN